MLYGITLLLIAIIFSVIMLITCALMAHRKRKTEFRKALVTYCLFIIFLWLQWAFGLDLNLWFVSLALITVIGHDTFGYLCDYYHRSRHFDRYLHALGSYSFALFVFDFLNRLAPHAFSFRPYTAIFIGTLGLSLCSLFEICEFISDAQPNARKKHPQNQHGLRDTNFDLVSDVIGAAVAGLTYYFFLF